MKKGISWRGLVNLNANAVFSVLKEKTQGRTVYVHVSVHIYIRTCVCAYKEKKRNREKVYVSTREA